MSGRLARSRSPPHPKTVMRRFGLEFSSASAAHCAGRPLCAHNRRTPGSCACRDALQATGNLRGVGDRGDGGAKFHPH